MGAEEKAVDIGGRAGFLDAMTSEIGAHRRNEDSGVRHELI